MGWGHAVMAAGLISAGLFVALAAAACVAAALAVLATAQVDLSGPEAIARDGLDRGQQAPKWSLPDASGALRRSPPAGPLQLVIFADHSLKSFPSVLDGLRDLIAREAQLETVVLLRQRNDLAAPLLQLLGLHGVPVLTGSPALYARYNVRVGPFAIFVASDGQVRGSSLVNYDWQLAKLRQLADIPVESPPRAGDRGRPRRRGRASWRRRGPQAAV